MIPQSVPGISGAERAALLKKRHDPVDELVESARREVGHEDESVAGVGLHMQVDLFGDLCGGADELLAAGYGDDEFADGQVARLGTLTPGRGQCLRIAVPYPPWVTVGSSAGSTSGSGPSGS